MDKYHCSSSSSSPSALPVPPAIQVKQEPPPQKVEVTSAFVAPSGIIKIAENAGYVKGNLSITSMLIQGFLGGLYIAFGGMVAITVGKNTGSLPGGISKLLFGATFPIGLVLVVIAGAELVTGNMAALIPTWLNGRIKWWQMLNNWFWVYIGNFMGSLFCAFVLAFSTNLFGADPYLTNIQGIAHLKCKENSWYQNFALGIGCNILVALAIFMSMAAKDLSSKVICIWFPIQTFVTIGFEHCVANMFFVTAGIMYGADVSFGRFVGSNLVPVTLGNIVGASFFVGLIYWYLYGINQNHEKNVSAPYVRHNDHEHDDAIDVSSDGSDECHENDHHNRHHSHHRHGKDVEMGKVKHKKKAKEARRESDSASNDSA